MSTPFRYSALVTFHKCQRYYQLKHIEGLSDGSELSADIQFGSGVHYAMLDLFEGGDGHDVFRAFWDLQKDKPLEYTRYKHKDLSVIGHALIDAFVEKHMKKFKPQHLERKMLGKLGPHAFGGTADFIGEYNGTLSLVDWKTSAYPYDKYKLQHNEQIYGYVELARQELGLTVPQAVYGVAIKDHANPRWQFRALAITPENLTKRVANIRHTCDTIQGISVYLQNPTQCVVGKRICPYFSQCHGEASDSKEEEST